MTHTRIAILLGTVLIAGGAAAGPLPAGLPDHVPPAALRAEPPLPAPSGWPFPEAFSRTAGTGRLSGCAFYWTDFLYDDRGARGLPVQPPVTPFARSHGTFEYADPRAARNGADIFRAAIGLDAAASYWRVDWNTLVDPAVPIAVFALDTDDSDATGGDQWPAGAGVRSAGIEAAIVVSSRGAWLVDISTGARRELPAPVVDSEARSFVVRIPRATLAPTGIWRVRLAAGVADASGEALAPVTAAEGALPGSAAVYNVTFRSYWQEPPLAGAPRSPLVQNYWMELAQADALTARDVSPFFADVDWSALAAATTTAEPLPAGWTARWYVSSIEPGQGVIRDSSPPLDLRPNYLGRVQPYAVYVPAAYDGATPTPLTWLLHSAFQPHTAFAAVTPDFVAAACEERASICATTLGRGHDGWYFDEAELDFWEVWNRLASTYALDPDRTVIGGFSMGGYAAYRFGFEHPDLFAHAVVLGGSPMCGMRFAPDLERPMGPGRCATDGDTTPLVASSRWLPFYIAHGTTDELLPIGGTLEQVAAFDALDYRYRFEHYVGQPHIPWYLQDRWRPAAESMADAVRATDPGHVTLLWHPNAGRPEWGITATGAWWIGPVTARDPSPGAIARIDARTSARPDPPVAIERASELLVRDYTTPALVTELTWKPDGHPPTPEPRVELDLANIAALTVDLRRAGLGSDRWAAIPVATDGPSLVSIQGVAGPVSRRVARRQGERRASVPGRGAGGKSRDRDPLRGRRPA